MCYKHKETEPDTQTDMGYESYVRDDWESENMGASERAGVELYHNTTLLFILLFAPFFHAGNGFDDITLLYYS
jgi:hypothetical protein